jgi:hypothetical protein
MKKHVLTPHPPLYFVKRGCINLLINSFPLSAQAERGKRRG